VLYVLYAGLRGRTDRRAGIAGGIVAGEVLVFAGNGFRCPLTQLAERYGAQSGSVTDIYLPQWFAHNMPAIHTPLLVLMTYLHARNMRRSRQAANGAYYRRLSTLKAGQPAELNHPPGGTRCTRRRARL
jgi:hypothetical protein